MNAYTLPKSLNISGKEYSIRTDFRDILEILIAINDPDLQGWEKQEIMFRIIYPEYFSIPSGDYEEACKKAAEFIDCNRTEENKRPQPKIIDWEQDAGIVIPAVNKVAGKEVRALDYLHWWTFLGYFMEIEDGLASQVWAIRQKKAKGKKLEKWEKEFEQNNPGLVKLKKQYSEEQKREIANLEKWL